MSETKDIKTGTTSQNPASPDITGSKPQTREQLANLAQKLEDEMNKASSIYETFDDFELDDAVLDDIGGSKLDTIYTVVDKFEKMKYGGQLDKDLEFVVNFMNKRKENMMTRVQN